MANIWPLCLRAFELQPKVLQPLHRGGLRQLVLLHSGKQPDNVVKIRNAAVEVIPNVLQVAASRGVRTFCQMIHRRSNVDLAQNRACSAKVGPDFREILFGPFRDPREADRKEGQRSSTAACSPNESHDCADSGNISTLS